ncbi:hypothetical protein JTB14_003875 [Gonioctena quinquepunctata]|nr:hypothetical protein JTB14_003875 [Gonioctena quinquepunctata]
MECKRKPQLINQLTGYKDSLTNSHDFTVTCLFLSTKSRIQAANAFAARLCPILKIRFWGHVGESGALVKHNQVYQ